MYSNVNGVVVSFFSLSVCVWTNAAQQESQLELKLVQLIWRHGDRNPEHTYPNDPYKNPLLWPDGVGELTETGINQHKTLGRYLRRRYKGFIKPYFDPKEVYIQSSSFNRTILSARSNLQGLFDFDWNSRRKFPIPINLIPINIDNKLLQQETLCPRWKNLFNELLNSSIIKNIIMENRWLFKYLSKHTGKSVQTIYELNLLYNTLYIENLKNFTLPEWTKPIFPGRIFSYLSDFAFKTMTYTNEMKKLRGGPLVKEMLRHMKFTIEGRAGGKHRKMYAYSGHDLTITTVLDTLGVYDLHTPYYASVLMIELRKNNTSNNYYVDILYRNDSSRDPYVLHPPGCPTASCDFKIFEYLYTNLVPKNWAEDCNLKTFDLLSN